MPVDTLAAGMMLTHVGCTGLVWDLLMQLTPMCLFPEFPFLTLRLCMTIRCLAPVLSSEKLVEVQDPARSLPGSSGAEVKDLTQFVNERTGVRVWVTRGMVK